MFNCSLQGKLTPSVFHPNCYVQFHFTYLHSVYFKVYNISSLCFKCSIVLKEISHQEYSRKTFYEYLNYVWNVPLFTARKIDTKCIPSKLLCTISFYIWNVQLFLTRNIYTVCISKFTIFLLYLSNVPLFSSKFYTKSFPGKHFMNI